MIHAIGFDLDNTLYDQWDHVRRFCDAAGEHVSARSGLSPLRISRTFGAMWWRHTPAHPKLFDVTLEALGLDPTMYLSGTVALYRNFRAPVALYEGVGPMLERLARRSAAISHNRW